MKKIVTWNVNGLRAVSKKGFSEWFQAEDIDILCLQETKCHLEQLDETLANPEGYHSYFHSAEKKGYSGLALFSREKPLEVRPLGVSVFDSEGRVQIISYDNYTVVNTYFPNSQEKGKRLDYKLAFCDALFKELEALVKSGQNIILLGDYNIAHKEIDLKNPDTNHNSPGFLPQEREWMEFFLNAGYVDCFRHFTPEADHYTWWSYRTKARDRNAGWRIDYHCVNSQALCHVKSCEILSDVMGSDHCPVVLNYSA